MNGRLKGSGTTGQSRPVASRRRLSFPFDEDFLPCLHVFNSRRPFPEFLGSSTRQQRRIDLRITSFSSARRPSPRLLSDLVRLCVEIEPSVRSVECKVQERCLKEEESTL